MKKKHNEGFSLVETLVAITVLALIVIPTCSGIIMAFRMNAKADELMQAQLAVSSAVETLMAEGIPADTDTSVNDYGVQDVGEEKKDRFPDVIVEVIAQTGEPYFQVTVTSNPQEGETTGEVSVTTYIRAVDTESPTESVTPPEAGGST